MNIAKFTFKFLRFLPYYTGQVVKSNWQVIRDVVTRENYARPAVLKIPISLKHPGEIFMLANLVTMTPGTLCLDISEDRSCLFIHVMFNDDEEIRREIADLERRIGGLFS